MHTHTKPLGQRKVSPPGPTFMSNDQMGMLLCKPLCNHNRLGTLGAQDDLAMFKTTVLIHSE